MYDEHTNGGPIDDYTGGGGSDADVTDSTAPATHNGTFLSTNISVGGSGGCNVVAIGKRPM